MGRHVVLFLLLVACTVAVEVVFSDSESGNFSAFEETLFQCPESLCQQDLPNAQFETCLVKEMSVMPWTLEWNDCEAAALFRLAWFFKDTNDPANPMSLEACSGFYLGSLLAQSMVLSRRTSNSQWRRIANLMWGYSHFPDSDQLLFKLRFGFLSPRQFMNKVLFRIMEIPDSTCIDAITVSPLMYGNEFVFAPSLTLPSRRMTVAAMLMEHKKFDTSAMYLAMFPWPLQKCVDLTAMYLRDVAVALEVKYIWPGDNGGILSIGKLSQRLFQIPNAPLLETLERSCGVWPPVYPPPALSKLVPGHEKWAPPEAIVAVEGGMTPDMWPNVVAMEQHAQALLNGTKPGTMLFLKKEYSAANGGVERVTGHFNSLLAASRKMASRVSGDRSYDLSLSARWFLQRGVYLGKNKPLGVRFLAHRGKIVAGHVSHLIRGAGNGGIIYETVNEKYAQEATEDFVKTLSFTGFGAAWWWTDHQTGRPYLIDFNARFERLTCIHPALPEEEKMACPCYAFQMGFDKNSTRFVKGGFRYMDPSRALMVEAKALDLLDTTPWILNPSDTKMMTHIGIWRKEAEHRRDVAESSRK